MTHDVDSSTMELSPWPEPYNPERAYPILVNHFGIHRTALATTDIIADVAPLKAQGIEFLSPIITPCCSGPDASGSIVAFYDPDGTIVELVEQLAMSWLMLLVLKLRDLFGWTSARCSDFRKVTDPETGSRRCFFSEPGTQYTEPLRECSIREQPGFSGVIGLD